MPIAIDYPTLCVSPAAQLWGRALTEGYVRDCYERLYSATIRNCCLSQHRNAPVDTAFDLSTAATQYGAAIPTLEMYSEEAKTMAPIPTEAAKFNFPKSAKVKIDCTNDRNPVKQPPVMKAFFNTFARKHRHYLWTLTSEISCVQARIYSANKNNKSSSVYRVAPQPAKFADFARWERTHPSEITNDASNNLASEMAAELFDVDGPATGISPPNIDEMIRDMRKSVESIPALCAPCGFGFMFGRALVIGTTLLSLDQKEYFTFLLLEYASSKSKKDLDEHEILQNAVNGESRYGIATASLQSPRWV
eukprot:GHVP01009859.1.p1 GENE.GHVP01009859.1~~GHVP01009859.1.p1  ORF type:complete len:306 (-),score=18.59 GHVP01009859.1:722-1639(-)